MRYTFLPSSIFCNNIINYHYITTKIITFSQSDQLKMNISDFVLQLLVLLPVSLASAAVLGYIVPRAGATNVNPDHDDGYLAADLSDSQQHAHGTEKYIERNIQSQWEKHRRWHLVYKLRLRNIRIARVSKLSLITFGAVAQVAATQVPSKYRVAASFVGGVCVGIGTYIKTSFLTDEKVKSMVTSFYISQAIRSEVCKFRAKADSYNGGSKDKEDEALEQLRKECTRLSKIGDDRIFLTMHYDLKAIPPSMDTKDKYLKNRVDCTIDHLYMKKGRRMAKKAKILSNAENVLLFAGTLTGIGATQQQLMPAAIKNVFDILTGFAGAFTTVSAGIANHLSKAQYEQISEQYFDAAETLRELKENWPLETKAAGSPGWNQQIINCEDVILSTAEQFAKLKTGNQDMAFRKSAKKRSFEKV